MINAGDKNHAETTKRFGVSRSGRNLDLNVSSTSFAMLKLNGSECWKKMEEEKNTNGLVVVGGNCYDAGNSRRIWIRIDLVALSTKAQAGWGHPSSFQPSKGWEETNEKL